jgi:serine-type D-Ala-D-Ala carboxypeptidase/endopeptidase
MTRTPAALLCLFLTSISMAPQTPTTKSTFDGVWLGTLQVGSTSLRVQLHLQTTPAACTIDSVDQGGFGIPCTLISASDTLTVDVPTLKAKWSGKLSPDGTTLTGIFTQGGDLPLSFAREATPIAAAPPKAPDVDPAMPPVSLVDLQAVLDKDLAVALKSGALAPSTHTGVTIGVMQHGVRRIFTYGPAKPDSVFEIGSISKTFTALILAQMVEQKKVRLDEPVRELLPPNTVAKPAGPEITLLDLSDQHSGLPRMPDNFAPADPTNPYADYDAKLLYTFIAKRGVALPANAPFGYSNLGVGLLGQALSNRAGKPYPELLRDQVTGPLGMTDTAITLNPSMQSRFIQGYDYAHNPAHAWDLDALAGAVAIRSTAADMLTYLEAQLHPDHLPPTALASANGKTLHSAIALDQIIRAEGAPGMHIALNWFHIDATRSFWHNGGTGGFSSFALFNPDKDFAVIVLSNVGPGPGTITDDLGIHIAQRLTGSPAVSLAP